MEDSTDVHIIRRLVPVILSMTSSADKPLILHLHWNQSFSRASVFQQTSLEVILCIWICRFMTISI